MRLKDAFGIRKADVGGNDDKRRRLHSFAAQRERAISDLGGLALLEKAIASQRGRVADCGSTDPILIESTGDNVLLGDDNSLYFIDPIIGFKQEPRMLIDNLVPKS